VNGAILGVKKTEIGRKSNEIVTFAGVESLLNMHIMRWSRGTCVRLAFAVAADIEVDVLGG
jgi:lipopolysaccharide transport system ATP-binding protein